jgi:hypothetical protein
LLLCYNSRLTEHANAVLRVDLHPDSALVARSSLEGLWQLTWASQDPGSRAIRWRSFAFVRDWRLLREKHEAGLVVAGELKKFIQEGLAAHGEVHLTTTALSRRAAGRPLPDDPYNQSWHGMATVRQLAEAIGHLAVYLQPYSRFSDRHHWDFGNVVETLRVDGKKMKWRSLSPARTVVAAVTTFSCYADGTQFLNDYFSLGLAEAIRGYRSQLQEVLGIAGDNS